MTEGRPQHVTITTPINTSSPGSDNQQASSSSCSSISRRTFMFLIVFLVALYSTINLAQQPALSSCSVLVSAATRKEEVEAYIPTPTKADAAANEDEDKRYHNVLLQGHFNYETPPDLVQGWVKAWSKYFSNIMVVGPFTPDTRFELTRLNISVRASRADKSLASATYENLMLTLLEYKHDPMIEGVLYLHDDALVNLTRFTNGMYPFPTDTIVGTFGDGNASNALFNIHVQDGKGGNSPNVIYSKDGHYYGSQKTLREKLGHWGHWEKRCLPPLTNMLVDPENAHMYNNGSRANYEIPNFAQSDVLFVPTRFADAFAHHARPFVDNKVFLECAFPTIIHHMLKERNTSSQRRTVELCTIWDYEVRKKYNKRMVEHCIKTTENGYGVYHPFKIFWIGVKRWANMLDSVQNTAAEYML
jgi:hypothetical protein